jgi:nucleoside-triphosphatase THEP1
MSCAIILHGPVGSGKTRACLELVEKARVEGITVSGVISPRVYLDEQLIGYDCLNPASDEIFPIARLRDMAHGSDWFAFKQLIYAFSIHGFERANEILKAAAEGLSPPSLIFVDEFGRLEKSRRGLYPGALHVSKAFEDGVVAVFACRTNLVDDVQGLVQGRARQVLKLEPGEADTLWNHVLEILRP